MDQDTQAIQHELTRLQRIVENNAVHARQAVADSQGIVIARIDGVTELLTARIVLATAKADIARQNDVDRLDNRIDKHTRDAVCYVDTVTTNIKHTIEDLDERLTAEIQALGQRLDHLS